MLTGPVVCVKLDDLTIDLKLRPIHHRSVERVRAHTFNDGTPAHSFATLPAELATIVRNTCRTPNAGAHASTFDLLATPNAKQQRALELIQNIRV